MVYLLPARDGARICSKGGTTMKAMGCRKDVERTTFTDSVEETLTSNSPISDFRVDETQEVGHRSGLISLSTLHKWPGRWATESVTRHQPPPHFHNSHPRKFQPMETPPQTILLPEILELSWVLSRGNCTGGNCHGGNFPGVVREHCPGWGLSRIQ